MDGDKPTGAGGLIAASVAGGLVAGGFALVATRAASGKPPAPPPVAPHLTHGELAALYVAIAAITVLAALIPAGPIISYINRGWQWRAQLISNSLGDQAKDFYLHLFQREPSAQASAAARFDAYYRRWYGRSRLVLPALLTGVLLLVYSLALAAFAAQHLLPDAILPGLAWSVTPIAAAAVAGAYVNVSLDAIDKVSRRDLSPEDLNVLGLRLAASAPVGYAVASLAEKGVGPFLAFAVGAFPPQELFGILRRLAAKQLGAAAPAEALSDLITKLSGVDPTVSERIASIGITTVPQLAYSDPIQLTMRTNMNFNFVLDLVSQAQGFVYLDDKLTKLRPMGLRGSYELSVLCAESRNRRSPLHANSTTVLRQAAKAVGVTPEGFTNTLHQIADDPYVQFLVHAYGN